ncbi:MAG: glycine cleavage system protein R [Verrucomicrobiales bacterium]|jgi:glycine cleavage system regulatory protein|nr:glycine cleavage system protein R [Verrucomicrobiales bacterium]
MHAAFVLTVIGRDRPGLVERLASLIAAHGGNWLESRMGRLGGEFAGILRFSLPADHEAELRHDLEALETSGLTVLVRRDTEAAPTPGRVAIIELVGHDRPGIVQQIAAIVAARGANVEELESECVSAPMSGEPLFKATLRIALPSFLELPALRAELERVSADLLVDAVIRPVTP